MAVRIRMLFDLVGMASNAMLRSAVNAWAPSTLANHRDLIRGCRSDQDHGSRDAQALKCLNSIMHSLSTCRPKHSSTNRDVENLGKIWGSGSNSEKRRIFNGYKGVKAQ
jgi:hypothetical protein